MAPLTVYLGAPPIVNQGTALEECEQLAETRLTGSSETVEVRWTRLPRAQWECIVDGDVVADLGWYATPSTDSTCGAPVARADEGYSRDRSGCLVRVVLLVLELSRS